jgi:lipopolysaccharide/colanic/teichoic acid biosynthesis glycosyltransferase
MESTTSRKWREENLTSCTADSSTVHSDFITEITHNPSLFYCTSKRLLDIVLATFGIVVLLPVFLIIAIGIKLEDRGNIFYFREMIGLRGRRFIMLKFRTMIPNADVYLEQHPELMLEYQENMKLQHDPRITRLGRFLRKVYLDELPQLFNVLVGHMSLVGPRAIHERELILYGEYAEKRHSVKPGITGIWQISPNRYRCYEDRIPFDIQYIDNRSFFLDLRILCKTLKVFINPTGV